MIQLSIAIIAFNEEKNIGRCLDSIMTIADDIVVVDSGSKDKTIEICIQKGARVVHQDFLGHIEQKNFAISKASNDSTKASKALKNLESFKYYAQAVDSKTKKHVYIPVTMGEDGVFYDKDNKKYYI